MEPYVLQTAIEFIKDEVTPDSGTILAKTGDSLLGVAIFLVLTCIFVFFLVKQVTKETNNAIHKNRVSCKSKAYVKAMLFAGIIICMLGLCFSGVPAVKALANGSQSDNIKVIVDKENNSFKIKNTTLTNNSNTRLIVKESSAELVSNQYSSLKSADLSITTEKGTIFKGKANKETYKIDTESYFFDNAESLHENFELNGISVTEAENFIGKGPVIKVSFYCEQKCIVTFDNLGHGTKTETQIINIGDKVTKPEDPTDESCTFEGWKKDKDCNIAWDFDKEIVKENTVIYAKWIGVPVFCDKFMQKIVGNPRYKEFIDAGKISVSLTELTDSNGFTTFGTNDSDTEYDFNASKQMRAASMIKLLVLAEFLNQVNDLKINLEDVHIIDDRDKTTGGTGHINAFDLGTPVTYDDLALYMIMYSDNAATNDLIDILCSDGHGGIDTDFTNINNRAAKLHLDSTALNRYLIIEAATETNDNFVSALDCATILKKIYDRTIVEKKSEITEQLCSKAEGYLKKQTDQAAMGSVFEDAGIVFGHKTGNLHADPTKPFTTDARHDSGIVYWKDKPFVLSVTMQIRDGELFTNDVVYANEIHKEIAKIAIETMCIK